MRGPTNVVIFEGIMTAEGYNAIIKQALVPFVRRVYPEGHRFMQDNDPKHTSKLAQKVFEEEGINWWKTPPESPDCNPIENLWHELKEFNQKVVKPKKRKNLWIRRFWSQVTVDKCQTYIGHLRKVLPKVIECNGGPTGF